MKHVHEVLQSAPFFRAAYPPRQKVFPGHISFPFPIPDNLHTSLCFHGFVKWSHIVFSLYFIDLAQHVQVHASPELHSILTVVFVTGNIILTTLGV